MSTSKESNMFDKVEAGSVQKGVRESEVEGLSDSVEFCCCASLKNESFYLFINVLDLVYTTFVTMLANLLGIYQNQTDSAVLDYSRVAIGTLNVLLFILALASFCMYLVKRKFNTSSHKTYSIVRIIVCAIR